MNAPLRTVTLRASGISEWLDCPARAEAKQLLGKRTPSSGKALLGRAVHASTAVYDRSVLERQGITIDESAGAAVDVIGRPDDDVVLDEDERADKLADVAVALHKLYCTKIARAGFTATVSLERGIAELIKGYQVIRQIGRAHV